MPNVSHMRPIDAEQRVTIVMMGGVEGQIYLLGSLTEIAQEINEAPPERRLLPFEALFTGEDTPHVAPVFISLDIVSVLIGETSAGEAHKSLSGPVQIVLSPADNEDFHMPARGSKSRLN